jgi:uncharacterized protein YbjQ (UPF0145 family)
MIEIGFFFALISVGYFTGKHFESQHYMSIRRRESEYRTLPHVSDRPQFFLHSSNQGILVSGSAVISIDYFKSFSMMLRNIIGGRVEAYESLLDRARREAVLRMKEEALQWGAKSIVNVRLETSNIGASVNSGKSQQIRSVEVVAYGTALK